MTRETIYALSSGAGTAGVAVVRLSGPRSDAILAAMGVSRLPEPRYARLYNILCPRTSEILDNALVLRFPAPGSFTGEDVAELHLHGGDAVLAAVFGALEATGLARMAEPGEFTRRAFENGKLDLTAAEAVGDLIAARTEEQRKLALRQYDGDLATLYGGWRAKVIDLLGYAEAGIDFSDEELPEALHEDIKGRINDIKQEVVNHSSAELLGEQIRVGFPISILGAPNVGKSSLMNALARRDVAIVSEMAGTTRDVIEVQMNLNGFAVTISDTAGIRDASDQVEAEGVRRAESRAQDAALKLVVVDVCGAEVPERVRALIDADTIVVHNKIDLLAVAPEDGFSAGGQADFAVSVRTGDGIGDLVTYLGAEVKQRLSSHEGAVPTRQRHREALRETIASLERAAVGEFPELVAEDIRLAARALGRITGRIDIDEILDTVFRDFCIGK
jgi:tRNA modification GTPase